MVTRNIANKFDTDFRSGMKLKPLCRKVYDYVRYDLKEIAFPSSLPDSPHIKKRRKLTWKERYYVLKEASRLYAASWVRDIGPDLRPNDYKKDEEGRDEGGGVKAAGKEKEPSTLEDLGCRRSGYYIKRSGCSGREFFFMHAQPCQNYKHVQTYQKEAHGHLDLLLDRDWEWTHGCLELLPVLTLLVPQIREWCNDNGVDGLGV
ncbi:uncharacterized protein LOC131154541 isoform X2 [Malania oleifera]|uniref:uncharacterized protein LOC131154541 isoform X2 n=1 Tax=Malania oleifera TaxID=397392 RepID=UPI0025AEB14A|nr:uncharacterized protein LOC131154541 isoform X2 [Malania oleifera]